MHIDIGYGRDRSVFEVAADDLIPVRAAPPVLSDPVAAVRAALDAPLDFPPLRRALTADDRVTIVIDERLPRLADLLLPLLEEVTRTGVSPSAITLLSAVASPNTAWVDDLPDDFQDMTLEVHNPSDRRRLSYLATTRQGRRLYLNRSLVDADQVVVLSGRGYHPWFGYTGAAAALFPALSDEATLKELSAEPSERDREALVKETQEVAWLLGVPFFVQIIEGPGDTIADVLAGPLESSAAGQQRLDERWRVGVAQPANVVIASLSGDPARHDFADLARALDCASRVVRVGGRIVLLTRADPDLDGSDLLLQADEPEQALELLRAREPLNAVAQLWAGAASHARIYLLSELPPESVEQLFATPLQSVEQAQRLLHSGDDCLFLEDAHKMLAVLE